MIPMPGTHAGLTLHEIGYNFKLLGIDIAITIQVKHFESNLEVATGSTQYSQEKDVIREGNEAT